MKNSKGQTLYYFLVFTMILVISWAMMLNIAKLIRDRMVMQNTADNIALSIATHKARTMNFVGGLNYLIGTILSVGTKPDIVQFPSYNTQEGIASYILGDYKSSSARRVLDKDVAKMKTVVKELQGLQEYAMISHLAYINLLYAQYNDFSGKYNLRIIPIEAAGKENAEKYFGLKRNKIGIKYLKTINSEIQKAHLAYNPIPGRELIDVIKSKFSGIESLVAKEIVKALESLAGGFQTEEVHGTSDASWYIADKNFHKQKTKIIFRKKDKDSGKPLFTKLLNINYPVMTVYSASAIYNTKGMMFPKQESPFTGFPPNDIDILVKTVTLLQSARVTAAFSKINWIVGAAVSAVLASTYASRMVVGNLGESVDKSPIRAYEQAKDGGWGAHLVPFKSSNEN